MLKRFFGSRNERLLHQYTDIVKRINDLESSCQQLSADQLRAKTAEFRQRYQQGESVDSLLPETFAVCREAAKRTLGMRHFDVQLIGATVLHQGKIAEMRTGEGKTLVATLPAYLNALTGQGVQIVTVNDYLAKRDAQWMGALYDFLGLTVGVNLSQMSAEDKRRAYACDVTYGTNNEFGFDYLRDNMVYTPSEKVQHALHFAIVDEVDSILIDEARTPLVISGQADDQTDIYHKMAALAGLLTPQKGEEEAVEEPGDFIIDEKNSQILLTEQGHERAEEILRQAGLLPAAGNLYDAQHVGLIHTLYATLRARHLFFRDQHYVVQSNEIVIVDEFTGRLMPGRRWSDGLHQAIEAKEAVRVQRENQTLASITFQNYFRLYHKLSGMTGTADTEAFEFYDIYRLETVVMPTHHPVVRIDYMDQVYVNTEQKYKAIIRDIRDCHRRGQPVLVGTTSIENSEIVSRWLNTERLPHQVLNAKQNEREADVIAQAGRLHMITIATNMAGRGTDIVLGGNCDKEIEEIQGRSDLSAVAREDLIRQKRQQWRVAHDEVVAAGGLHVIGTERHESRRVDNQLRGRSGRQGDPGSSRFYLSLEDPLLRIFAGERIQAIMRRLRLPEEEPIEHPLVTRSLETAQRKVEARNFDIRKQLLEYDDVANEQRKIVYEQRDEFLRAAHLEPLIDRLREGVVYDLFRQHIPEKSVEEQWELVPLEKALLDCLAVVAPVSQWVAQDWSLGQDAVLDRLQKLVAQAYQERMAVFSGIQQEMLPVLQRSIVLQSLDAEWREHLSCLDQLRQGIHLRGYAAKNPKQEYKREAFLLFDQMLHRIKYAVIAALMQLHVEPMSVDQAIQLPLDEPKMTKKVGRNDVCPCGSQKKYKHCHGRMNHMAST